MTWLKNPDHTRTTNEPSPSRFLALTSTRVLAGSFTSEDIRGAPDLLEAQPVVGGQQGFQLLGSGHILADLREVLLSSPAACTFQSKPQAKERIKRQQVHAESSGRVSRLTFCLRASLRCRSVSSAEQEEVKLGLTFVAG